jgi:hypothetical protein
MENQGEIEEKSQIKILRELDMKRTEACLDICKVRTILRLSQESEFSDRVVKQGEEPIDWFLVFQVLDQIAESCEKTLDDMDRLTHLALLQNADYIKEMQRWAGQKTTQAKSNDI